MKNNILISVGIVLILIIAFQSYHLTKLSKQVSELSRGKADAQQPMARLQPPASHKPKSKPKQTDPNSPFGFQQFNNDKWNPFADMQRMQNEMNRMLGDFRSQFRSAPGGSDPFQGFSISPSVDLRDEGDHYVAVADIPNSDESNINVKLQGNRLIISAETKGQKKTDPGKSGGHVLRSERFAGRFERVINLPSPVEADKMKTDYKDGVLTVTIPKRK
jgi:HSP20 family protein